MECIPLPALSGSTSGNQSIVEILSRIQPEQIMDEDNAILVRLKLTIDQVENFYQDYEFNSVLHAIYKFFWSDFCDWYVEDSKKRIKVEASKETCLAIQDFCLREILLLLHPFTPFITEELWTLLGFSNGDSIQRIAPMSSIGFMETIAQTKIELDPNTLAEIDSVRELVTQLRALRPKGIYPTIEKSNSSMFRRKKIQQLFPRWKDLSWKRLEQNPLSDLPKSGLPAIVSNGFHLDYPAE